MSLRRRLVYLIALALPLSLLFGGLLSFFYSVNLVKKEMAGAVELGETTVREVVENLEKSPDPASAVQRMVSSFDNDRDINVHHVNSGGKTVSASRPAPVDTPPPEWLVRALWSTPRISVVPLPGALKPLGAIHIEAAPLNEISEVWEEMTLQFTIFATFFSSVLWLVSWTVDRALRPLEKLASALAEVGQGNFAAHVPESGPKELSSIYREFNRMANRLKEAEQQNRALNMQLNTVQEEERAILRATSTTRSGRSCLPSMSTLKLFRNIWDAVRLTKSSAGPALSANR